MVAIAVLSVAGAARAGLVADYRFAGNLESSVPGAPKAFSNFTLPFGTEAVAGCRRQALSFPMSEGLAIHTDYLPDKAIYTIIAQVRFETVTSYVRVINWFPSFGNDNGLYLLDGQLDFFDGADHTGTATVAPGQFAEFAVTRDASKLVTGYVNGIQQFTLTDSANNAVSPHPAGNVFFFQDNDTGGHPGEEAAGTVARIRLYDSALPAAEITNTVGCFGVRCRGELATIAGDADPNAIAGTDARDVINGLEGDDTIQGLAGNDLLCGDPENDTLTGGPGNDTVIGGPANDTLIGGPGKDILIGGGGKDKLIGGKGRDRLIGGGGRDLCRGGAGRDRRKACERGRA